MTHHGNVLSQLSFNPDIHCIICMQIYSQHSQLQLLHQGGVAGGVGPSSVAGLSKQLTTTAHNTEFRNTQYSLSQYFCFPFYIFSHWFDFYLRRLRFCGWSEGYGCLDYMSQNLMCSVDSVVRNWWYSVCPHQHWPPLIKPETRQHHQYHSYLFHLQKNSNTKNS